MRVSKLELADEIPSVGCDDAEEADAQETWYDAQDRERLWQREHTKGNVFGEHHYVVLDGYREENVKKAYKRLCACLYC